MKNYRKWIPVVMIFLMVISVYYYMDNVISENKEYSAYIKSGDECYDEKLYMKAIDEYMKAQEMRDSVSVDKKIADCYETQELAWETEKLYEKMLEKYPKNVTAYEYAMEYFMRTEDYANVYSINTVMTKRKLSSEKTQDIMSKIKYAFYLEKCDYAEVGQFFNGYSIVKAENGMEGLADVKGKQRIRCIYKKIGNYMSEAAPVVTAEDEAYFVDSEGNRVMNYNGEGTPEELGTFTQDRYWVKNGDTYSYYDVDGKKLGREYQNAVPFNAGTAAVQEDDRWMLIDSEFEQKGKDTYANIVIDDNGYAIRKELLFGDVQGKGYQLINTEGEIVSDEYYEDAKLMIDGTYAAVKKDGKWGFIDAEGELVIEPQYEDAKSFANGFAAVKKDGKWGFIDEKNNMVIEQQFDDAGSFHEAMGCFVKQEEKWYMLRLYSGNS